MGMKNVVNAWVIADLHFGHEKTLQYGCRPFKSLEDMERKLIARWNHVVKPNDLVYVVGDFCLFYNGVAKYRSIMTQLNGRKILIKGGHDRKSDNFFLNNGFDLVVKSLVINMGSKEICMIHDIGTERKSTLKEYDIVLHGHTHINKEHPTCKEGKFYNVNVEYHNYAPVNLRKIISSYSVKNKRRKTKVKLRKLIGDVWLWN